MIRTINTAGILSYGRRALVYSSGLQKQSRRRRILRQRQQQQELRGFTTTAISSSSSSCSGRSILLAVGRGQPPRQQEQQLRCSSSAHCNRRYFSSLDTPEDPAAAAEALRRKVAAAAASSPPKAVFPWRHETPDNPIPRFVDGTEESMYDNAFLPLPGQALVANMWLNVPFWQVFVGSTWRGDMAEDFAYAFSAGVAGVVSNAYGIPYGRILDPGSNNSAGVEGSTVEFNYPPPTQQQQQQQQQQQPPVDESSSSSGEDTAATNDDDRSDEKEKENGEQQKQQQQQQEENAGKENGEEEEEDDASLCTNADMMLDRPLINLYKSAHENGKHQLQIKLHMEPRQCMMRSLFCIPFLTRIQAETNPKTLSRMVKVIALIRSDFSEGFNELYSYVAEQLETKGDRLETTVEAEVLVEADEIFQVVDKDTGALLQGSDDGDVRRVMHVVKFENTVTTAFSDNFPYLPYTQLGNWIITDIDDLLGPKKWYHKSATTANNTTNT